MAEEKKKLYYSISEVAEMTGLKPHILRFWEGEFPTLRPRKNRAGNRAYIDRDVRIVRLIRHLLYDEKYTIEGAKKRLKTDRDATESQLSLPFTLHEVNVKEILADLRKLQKMIDTL